MPSLLLYLIKLSISLGVVWLFYQLLLRRLTFYNWNRWYLLGYSLLAFFIPLINIGSFFTDDTMGGSGMIRYFSLPDAVVDPAVASRQAAFLLVWNITQALLVAGMLVGLMRMAARWLSLRRVRRKGRLIENAGLLIYQVDGQIIPFSFGKAIYINRHLHSDREWEDIILHEYVHIRQRHTIDILAGELLCVINWYNPFAWLIRHSIRQNLEFIADNKVLEQGLDKKSYQYHLLKVIGAPAYRLANNFNFSSLKKRIIMMNSMKSTRLHLVKFLFIFPLLAVLLVAFRGQHATTEKIIRIPRTPVLSSGGAVAGIEKIIAPLADTAPSKTRAGSVLRMDTAKRGEGLSDPLYIVDGVPASNGVLAKLNPSDIQWINILKDESAINAYGEKGRNGVIQITTKGHSPMIGKNDSAQVHFTIVSNSRDTGRINGVLFSSKDSLAKIKNEDEATTMHFGGPNQPLIIVDGKEISEEEMKKLDPKTIDSVNVLKGAQAVLKYGDKGKNGVIIATLKK